MPFKSKKQRRWMYANKPEMAREFEAATPKGAKLPEKVKKEEFEVRLDQALGINESVTKGATRQPSFGSTGVSKGSAEAEEPRRCKNVKKKSKEGG